MNCRLPTDSRSNNCCHTSHFTSNFIFKFPLLIKKRNTVVFDKDIQPINLLKKSARKKISVSVQSYFSLFFRSKKSFCQIFSNIRVVCRHTHTRRTKVLFIKFCKRALSYETKSKILAGLGQLGSLKFMNFLYFLKLFWVAFICD